MNFNRGILNYIIIIKRTDRWYDYFDNLYDIFYRKRVKSKELDLLPQTETILK